MNKLLCSAVLAAAALSPFAAQADDAAAGSNQLNNFFVTGNLGQSNYRVGGLSDKSDVFQSVRFGWRWNNIVGAEAGYTSLGQAKQYIGPVTVGFQPKAWICFHSAMPSGGSIWASRTCAPEALACWTYWLKSDVPGGKLAE